MFDKGRTRLTGTLPNCRIDTSQFSWQCYCKKVSLDLKGLNSLYFSRLYCSIAYDLVHADTELRLKRLRGQSSYFLRSLKP